MDRTDISSDDEGKRVRSADGDDIGMVSEVRGDTAYVDPDPGVTDTIRSKLGWGDSDQEDYMLPADQISTITDDEIRLKR